MRVILVFESGSKTKLDLPDDVVKEMDGSGYSLQSSRTGELHLVPR